MKYGSKYKLFCTFATKKDKTKQNYEKQNSKLV